MKRQLVFVLIFVCASVSWSVEFFLDAGPGYPLLLSYGDSTDDSIRGIRTDDGWRFPLSANITTGLSLWPAFYLTASVTHILDYVRWPFRALVQAEWEVYDFVSNIYRNTTLFMPGLRIYFLEVFFLGFEAGVATYVHRTDLNNQTLRLDVEDQKETSNISPCLQATAGYSFTIGRRVRLLVGATAGYVRLDGSVLPEDIQVLWFAPFVRIGFRN